MILRSLSIVGICLILNTFALSIFAGDGEIDPYFLTATGFDKGVRDIATQQNGKLIAVGEFTSVVGVPINRIVRLELDGRVDLNFNRGGTGANGDIYTVKILADDKILIGGNFTAYNNTPINRIARLNPDGTLDSTFNTGSGANSSVNQIILQPDNQILIAGGFTAFGGAARRAVARLSYDGVLDQNFAFTSNFYFNAPIKALALQSDGKVLIGGDFFNDDNGLNNNIARLNANGSLDSAFQARTNSIFSSPVSAIAIRADGKILIGGQFSTVNGIQKVNVALLNVSGTLDTSFTTTNVNRVLKLGFQTDGKIVVAGGIQYPQDEMKISRLNSNGSSDSSFNPNETGVVNSFILTSDNRIIVGGLLSGNPVSVGGANPGGVRKLNSDGSRDNSYLTRSGAVVGAEVTDIIPQADGKTVIRFVSVGGSTVGGLSRSGLARLNSDGTVDENFAPNLIGSAIATQPDGSVIVGGVLGRYFRKISSNGLLDPSFIVESVSPSNSFGQNVEDMAGQPDGKVLAVGNFQTVAGIARKGMVRLNLDGSVDQSFNHNLSFNEGYIRRVSLQPDGRIWVSGLFQDGLAASSVFRLNSNGTAETFIQANNLVNEISPINNEKVYLCGDFTTLNGIPAKNVARLNQDGTYDPSFVSPVITGSSVAVNTCLAQPDGKVIIGGQFSGVNGILRSNIARLNADGSFDTSFNNLLNVLGNNSRVYSLARQTDGKVILGGEFSFINEIARYNIARLIMRNSAQFDFDGDNKSDLGVFRPSNGFWYVQQSSAGLTGLAFGLSTDKITPADFDGDGKTDYAIFRSGTWYLQRSTAGFTAVNFGTADDLPVPADYDGDGKADVAVFRPSSGTWYVQGSTAGFYGVGFGISGDKPVPADYDGDGKADLAVNRAGNWYIQRSQLGFTGFNFGLSDDKLVPADYDGDGRTDVAVFRPSNGTWYIQGSTAGFYGAAFGLAADLPTPADYDGDGKADIAVFRNGTWYLNRSTAGFTGIAFGLSNDQPAENAFVR